MEIKKITSKINFKEKRYVIPLIILFPVLYLVFSFSDIIEGKEEEKPQEFLSTSLGVVEDTILSKNLAYEKLYKNKGNRTMIQTIGEEEDSIKELSNFLNEEEKRFIDSLEFVKNRLKVEKDLKRQRNNIDKQYYNEVKPLKKENNNDYESSMEIVKMLNKQADTDRDRGQDEYKYNEEENPVALMREQFLLLDSLEKARDPEHQSRLEAEKKLMQNQKLKAEFLNNTYEVKKGKLNQGFNTISKKEDNNFIKAVIDENIKGYLGSRIRFRLLDDIYVRGKKIEKGKIIYANISGFSLQRVNLNIVSILEDGEIIPINLSVYDVDGMKGLYVPRSQFREMMRELGENSIQGTRMDENGNNFYSSLISKAFTSSSKMIANMIRANKAKLKYNSYIYLINEREIKNNK